MNEEDIKKHQKTLWISVGEVSGDMHAGAVVDAIRKKNPDIHIRGIGGEYAQKAGMECIFPVSMLSVMGIWDVVKKLFTILSLLRAVKQDFITTKPDALLVIDAPSFNFRLIRMAHSMGIPVYYYIIPKVWASRPQRVEFLKHYCKELFCIFPFEIAWLEQHGIHASYVGNPLIRYTQDIIQKQYPKDEHAIVLMPGSRKSEVEALLPLFIRVAHTLYAENPKQKFFCILAPSMTTDYISSFIPPNMPITLVPSEERYSVIAQSYLCLVASGTATLEIALLGTPMIVAYIMGNITAWIMKRFIIIPFVSLPNIILNKAVVPELLQENATVDSLYAHAKKLLEDRQEYDTMLHEFQRLYGRMYTECNPAELVAEKLLQDIQ